MNVTLEIEGVDTKIQMVDCQELTFRCPHCKVEFIVSPPMSLVAETVARFNEHTRRHLQ
jgi:hypothetical protein